MRMSVLSVNKNNYIDLASDPWDVHLHLHNKMEGGSNKTFREYIISMIDPFTEKDCLICANEQIVSIILK